MSLDEQIREQYNNRLGTESRYNSVYSRLSSNERIKTAQKLVGQFLGNASGKRVLEIGAGQGDNVRLMKACGFTEKNIFLNELLPERIAAARQNHPTIKIYEGNAIHVAFEEQYDCVFQSTVFTSVLNTSDRKALAEKMWELLKPGGIILWYDFVYDNPRNKHVKKVTAEEARQLFPEAVAIEIKKTTLAPPIGRKVGKLYGFFNLPFLRSHIFAVFQKPAVGK